MKLKHQIAMQLIEVQRAERFLNTEHEHLQELKAQRLQCSHIMIPPADPRDVSGPHCTECGITDLELSVETRLQSWDVRQLPNQDVSGAFRQVLNTEFHQFTGIVETKA